MIAIAVLLVIFFIVAMYMKKKEKRPIDWFNIFIIGVIWAGAGVPMENYAVSTAGIIMMVLGGLHRKDWKKNKQRWKELNEKQKKFRLVLMGILLLLIVLTFILFWFR